MVARDISKDLANAREARLQDRTMGLLAPRRDAGELRDTYGALNAQRIRGQEMSEAELIKRNIPKRWAITAGDRVVLLDGRDKGKIGKVLACDRGRGELTVEGLNLVCSICCA